MSDGKAGGIAVHTAARVLARAQPGEIVATATIKELVAGSDIEFVDRGTTALKGIPGEWRLFVVVQPEISATDGGGCAIDRDSEGRGPARGRGFAAGS